MKRLFYKDTTVEYIMKNGEIQDYWFHEFGFIHGHVDLTESEKHDIETMILAIESNK